jgi:DNA-binding winged helix-turn-helix (wHTH) protein
MQQQLITQRSSYEPMHHSERRHFRQHEMNGGRDAVSWFGRCCVLPRARQLLVDGQPVELGARAFDLLMVLIVAPGTVLTKNEIVSRVWPDTIVEEGNLKVQMSALRKVLSEDRDVIKTIHGRGYVFASEVTAAPAERMPLTAPWGPFARSATERHKPRQARKLGRDGCREREAWSSRAASAVRDFS